MHNDNNGTMAGELLDPDVPPPATTAETSWPDCKVKNHHPGVNARLQKRTREEIQEEAEKTRTSKRAQLERHAQDRQEKISREAAGSKEIAKIMDQHAEEEAEDEEEAERLEAMAVEGGEDRDEEARAIDDDADAVMTDVVSHLFIDIQCFPSHRQLCTSQVSKKTQREKREERATSVIAAIDAHRRQVGSLAYKAPSKTSSYDAFILSSSI